MVLEKYHTAKLDFNASSAVYSRLANRFLKECEEVLRTIPDKVQNAAEILKHGVPIEEQEDSGTIPRFYCDDGIYMTHNWEWRFFSSEEDGKYIFFYYFFDSQLYDTTYCGVKHTGASIEEINYKRYRQKGPIRYFCMYRPPSPGGIPNGYVTYESYPHLKRRPIPGSIGEVTYFDAPTQEDAYSDGLSPDPDWLSEWSAIGFQIYDFGNIDENLMDSVQAESHLKELAKHQWLGKHAACPRCGQNRMQKEFGEVVTSRHNGVKICSACAIHEKDLEHILKAMPLGKWAYIKRIQDYNVQVADYELRKGELT